MGARKVYLTVAIVSVIFISIFLMTLIFMVSNVIDTLDELVENSDSLDIKVSSLFNEDKTSSDSLYILKEYNGIIGVFNEYGELTDIIDVEIKSLPRQDQAMLIDGIKAYSKKELSALIEDYTG